MARIFRDRIGTTKLSLFVMSVAVLALFCFAAVPSASAQTSFYLSVKDSGGDTIPTDAVLVTVTLDPMGAGNNTASVTFTKETTSGYLGYKTVINVNGAATVTVSGVTTAGGNQTLSATPTSPGSLDGFDFAADSFETSVTGGSADGAYTSITFELMKSSGTWSSASNVLAETSAGAQSVDVAAQIGSNTNGSDDTLDAGGVYTPEPTSYLLFGSGLLLLGVISRKKLGLGRG